MTVIDLNGRAKSDPIHGREACVICSPPMENSQWNEASWRLFVRSSPEKISKQHKDAKPDQKYGTEQQQTVKDRLDISSPQGSCRSERNDTSVKDAV
ncbi:MAG: hypothetical protein PW843_03410 [Azospirillaceae bacterium]|nr:hypothetical protein [Azospirillaceae bacterium]